jgi:hypothetical protein
MRKGKGRALSSKTDDDATGAANNVAKPEPKEELRIFTPGGLGGHAVGKFGISALTVVVIVLGVVWLTNKSSRIEQRLDIEFSLVPPRGTDDKAMHPIAGQVNGLADPTQYAIVVYAFTSEWYVQPMDIAPLTELDRNGVWSTTTHEGFKYAAVLVKKPYTPPAKGPGLPLKQGNVIDSVTVDGKTNL